MKTMTYGDISRALIAAGWKRVDAGWVSPNGGEPVSFSVARDRAVIAGHIPQHKRR